MKKHLLKIIIISVFILLGIYYQYKQSYYQNIENNISASSTIREESLPNESNNPETKYTIQKGDTLWDLAEKYYGSGFEYHKIIEKNPGKTFQFADGRQGLIYEGTEIII